MKKDNLKKLRIILILSFMAELISTIALYIGTTQVIKIGKITIINFLGTILSITTLILLFILFNKTKKKSSNYKKLYCLIICSMIFQILTIIFSCISKTTFLTPYAQLVSDILKILPILYLYKESIKLIKKKNFFNDKKCILIMSISYLIPKISYILVSRFSGLIIRPIFSTITIIGTLIFYTLYIKFLEKVLKG